MNMFARSLCLFLALASAAPATEILWQNFDTAATGSVATLFGWSRAPWLSSLTGSVVNAGTYVSASNVVELPWDASGSSVVYSNLNSVYNPTSENPVIRCSARLLTANTNMYFQVGLRNRDTGAMLSFEGTNGYGTFGTETHDVVFVPLVTNRFVDLTFFYNRSNNYYRLDYNYTNRLAWSSNNAPSPLVHTQFNQFVATRINCSVSNTGAFYLDNVRVETFPPYVWAWWRCDDTGAAFVEQLGSFLPTQKLTTVDVARAGSSDPVFDGQGDFHNDAAVRQLRTSQAPCVRSFPRTSNWTLEVAFRMAPGQQNVCFLDWGKQAGFDTNGAWISFNYHQSLQRFFCNLRDADQADTSYEQIYLSNFSPDNRWHHVALLKIGTALSVYLDYQLATNISLAIGATDGAYAFDTQTRASIGQALNNGNACGDQTLIDEIRFSGRDLTRAEFLQPGQPMIVSIANEGLWHIPIKGILGRTYRLEASSSSGPDAAWLPLATTTVVSTFGAFDVPAAAPSNFFRVIRQN